MRSTEQRSDNLLVSIGFATFVVIGLNGGLMGVAWPSVRDTFGVGDGAYGAMAMVATLGSLAITFYSGKLTERFGIGPLLIASGGVGALGYLGYALAPTWWALVLSGLVAGIGLSAINPGINTHFATRESAGRMNWLHACFGLGATLGPIVMTAILRAELSWRWAYILLVAIYALLAAGFGLTLKRWPPATRTRRPNSDEQASAQGRATWTLAVVSLSALLFFTFTGMEAAAGQWPYTLFTEGRSIDPALAGMWISGYWMSMTVGRVFFGFVADKAGTTLLVRLCLGGVIGGAVLIWAATVPWLGLVGLVVCGFCLAPLFPLLTSNTPERVGEAHAANAIGYQITAVKLGLAAVPALGGVLAARWGVDTIGPFLAAVSIVSFLLHEATIRASSRSGNAQT